MLRLGLPIAGVILVLDQLTKIIVRGAFGDPPVDAVPPAVAVAPFFDLVLHWNRGISFSIMRSDSPYAPWLFAGLSLAIAAGLGVWLARLAERWNAVALALVIGGAVGNAIDRIRLGAVVDFLYFHWQEYYWPAFNLADSAICVGVGMLLIDGLFLRREKAKTPAN